MCVYGCLYKKIYYDFDRNARIASSVFRASRPPAGRLLGTSSPRRYLGVMLYDADRIEEAASVPDSRTYMRPNLASFFSIHAVRRLSNRRRVTALPRLARGRSPFAGLQDGDGVEGSISVASEYRTLPIVWYVPPLSPIQSAAQAGKIGHDGEMPDVRSLRIPLKYLANLLTAGKEEPVALGLERMLAMRAYMRAETVDGVIDESIARRVGLSGQAIEDMYHVMAIANYEDRFVIPTAHREINEDAYDLRGSCGFSFGNGCSGGVTETNLFGTPKRAKTPMEVV